MSQAVRMPTMPMAHPVPARAIARTEGRLYKFTNGKGNVRYGIVIARMADGAYVLNDEFQAGKGTIQASYGYIPFEGNPYINQSTQSTEFLDLADHIEWRNHHLANVAKRIADGTFETWWPDNIGNVVKAVWEGQRKR